ncbi:MAG: aminotransferase [Gammaproteobacteria bacterium]|jgi:adenosylmethionine-8-amino-7-oxononanoate aminotransferase|nr:aminotransferase [Gammaproteobacteria bacterium]
MNSIIYPTTNLRHVEELNIVRGEGIYVYDADGKQYLEGLAGLWCASLGYGNEELIDAIDSQLKTLSYSHLFGGRTHQVVMDLADKLTGMVPVESGTVFFANSGSEANDSHMKMLHYYFNVTGEPQKKKIIALERSYHGVTMASAALTGLPAMHTHFSLPLEALGILRADSPHYYRGRQEGETEGQFTDRLIENLERLILKEGPETIAAFIAEPIGGASGVIVPPEGYFPEVQNLLTKHDILFWSDEVICGFGRTGNDFGCTTMGFTPQLMSLAKQLSSAYIPISASIIPDFMYQAMVEPSAEVGVFGHGYTYTGHPVACAAALKTLEIYERDNLFSHAATMGDYLQTRLNTLADHPLVGEVRGRGLIAAVELVANKRSGASFDDGSVGAFAKQACQNQGLLIRAVGGNSIAFCPPLIIDKEQIDEMLDKFKLALQDTLDHVQSIGLFKS